MNPYRTPNIVFMGDDSTSASAAVTLGRVALLLPPVLSADRDGVVTWSSVPGQKFSILKSADMVQWQVVDEVTATTGTCTYTNRHEGETSVFIRVASP